MTCDGCWGLHEEVHAAGAGPVAEHGDGVRVPAELRDVLLHPLERRDLVHQPVVGHLQWGVSVCDIIMYMYRVGKKFAPKHRIAGGYCSYGECWLC